MALLPEIHKLDADGDLRLAKLQLDRFSLIAAGRQAVAAADDASPLHATNAAGTFVYHDGVAALRAENLGNGWTMFRRDGLEGIMNDDLKARVLFQSVDRCCTDENPKPRSPKGIGSERISANNLFAHVGLDLPLSAVTGIEGWRTYYLMVDPFGGIELALPIVEEKKFIAFVERIFLADAAEEDLSISLTDQTVEDEIDVVVSRKLAEQ